MAEHEYIIRKAELETVCGISSRFPEHSIPEFAFAGKSNVGKSSLINAVLKRKSLARTSEKPGKTQTINFYRVNDDFYVVDLPGYGYTAASLTVRADWGKMTERYLKRSSSLKGIFLLIDIRHKLSGDDRLMYDWIAARGMKPIVVLTKADKLGKNDRTKAVMRFKEELGLSDAAELTVHSSVTGTGTDAVRSRLLELGGITV